MKTPTVIYNIKLFESELMTYLGFLKTGNIIFLSFYRNRSNN